MGYSDGYASFSPILIPKKVLKATRYGFNGKEKLNEFEGEGDAYDYGARMLDVRLGRWLSIDPLFMKGPDASPYSFAGNSPLIFKDAEGKENVIYLYDLRMEDPKLSPKTAQSIRANLNEIASQANKGFDEKGLTPRVVVLSKQEYSKLSNDASKLSKSDVLATIGNTQQLVQAETKLTKGGFDEIGIEGMGIERASGLSVGDKGNRIAINTDVSDVYAKTFGVSENTMIADVVQHAATHTAGLEHNNQYLDSDKAHKTSGNSNVPDLSTGGSYFQNNKERFKEGMSKVGEKLKSMLNHKFTTNKAKDEVFNKPINDKKK